MSIKVRLAENAALVESELKALFSRSDKDFGVLLEAERYSLLAPMAKRIRPTLVLEFCRLFGGNEKTALRFAAAVEMVHTYSLIHDDLPCMDNDDLRRGRPTCHKQFGEALALLAGDGLLTYAFEALATAEGASDKSVRDAVLTLASSAGNLGMIGGQVIDLRGEGETLPLDTLCRLHAGKTGALIVASATLGALAAGLSLDDKKTLAAREFAAGIGLAFQIVDDVLDVTSSEAELGKPIGSDQKQQKTTFLSYYTPKEAMEYAKKETERAVSAILPFDGADALVALSQYLIDRRG